MKSRANRKTFIALLLLVSMAGGAHALDVLSHRASYHASVQILRGDPATRAGEGFVEWRTEDHCETWLFSEVSMFRIGSGGDAPEFASNQVSFEAKDGSWYRFQNEFEGPGGAELSSGEAVVDEADEPDGSWSMNPRHSPKTCPSAPCFRCASPLMFSSAPQRARGS